MTHEEFLELIKVEPDRGTHNVRNTASPHWQRWLAPEFRVVVPLHELRRVRQRDWSGRQEEGQYLVRLRSRPATRPLRRHHGAAMDERAQGRRRDDHDRSVRLPDDGAQ